MDSKPRATFWRMVADLIRTDPAAAAQFTAECADLLDEGNRIDYLGAEEELERLVNMPQGQPTSGDGRGAVTTFALCNFARGELIDVVTVTGPGDRLGAAWDEFAERHGFDLSNVNPDVSVLETSPCHWWTAK